MLSLTVHGVRGSTPNATHEVSKYGGNTSCFEIETEKSKIFIDTGTGFSSANFNGNGKQVYVLFTHLHHDHIQGFLFNPELFQERNEIIISSGLMAGVELSHYLASYFSPPFFPPDVFTSLKNLIFRNFDQVCKTLKEEIDLASFLLKHPGGAVGYSFSQDAKKVVILLDNEFEDDQEAALIDFCDGADLLIWDGMFTEEELLTKRGWGHSTIEQAEYFTQRSNIRRTLICHHAPGRTDDEIESIEARLTDKRIQFGVEKTRFVL